MMERKSIAKCRVCIVKTTSFYKHAIFCQHFSIAVGVRREVDAKRSFV
jgi:hypothetical protein